MIKHISFLLVIMTLVPACGSDDDLEEEADNSLDKAVIQEILDVHNGFRSNVGITDLIWSEDIAISAQTWADELASNCDFKHSNDEYGENIWIGTTAAFEVSDVVESWGSEIVDYDYESNTCADDKDCGHYTQIVWKNTTQVGCGTATCNGFDIWVCQYDPPGNFIGQKPY